VQLYRHYGSRPASPQNGEICHPAGVYPSSGFNFSATAVMPPGW